MSKNEADTFLFGGGGSYAAFDTIGTTHTGVITEPPRIEDQTDIKTGEVRTFDNGDPMKMLVVTIQTSERDPSNEDDDGVRRLYVKGSPKPESKSMTAAIAMAVRAARANGLEVGGKLSVTYVADGVASQRGFNPPKFFTASYEPPSVAASAEFLGSEQQPELTPANPVQDVTPAAPVTVAATTSASKTPAELAGDLLRAGLSHADVVAATNLPESVIVAIANTI